MMTSYLGAIAFHGFVGYCVHNHYKKHLTDVSEATRRYNLAAQEKAVRNYAGIAAISTSMILVRRDKKIMAILSGITAGITVLSAPQFDQLLQRAGL